MRLLARVVLFYLIAVPFGILFCVLAIIGAICERLQNRINQLMTPLERWTFPPPNILDGEAYMLSDDWRDKVERGRQRGSEPYVVTQPRDVGRYSNPARAKCAD